MSTTHTHTGKHIHTTHTHTNIHAHIEGNIHSTHTDGPTWARTYTHTIIPEDCHAVIHSPMHAYIHIWRQ